jgi:hypothetical protein
MGLFGGAPVKDSSVFTLRTRAARTLPKTTLTQDFALAQIDPISSSGLTGDVAALNATIRHAEAPIKTAPAHFQGSAPHHSAPPAQLSDSAVSAQGTGQGTWAVVIGINDYPGTENDLRSATNDADDVSQALRILGVGNDHILNLRDGQVTSATLLRSVSWLAGHAGADSVAGFFYAGHVRKTPYGQEEIVTADGSAVSDTDLARALDRVQATRSWVAIAACYGLGFDEVMKPGRVLTAAAGRNSMAYENSAIGRSYMVEYMIRQGMIQGRASATVQSAFNYAVDRISREHPGREPVQIDNSNGALDLRPPNANRASEPQPEPEQPQQQTPPADEPPASDRPPADGSQHCTTKGLLRMCSNGG